jgi:hypothetical protein
MTYEETPVSGKVSKHAVKKEAGKVLDNFSTGRILWHVVKRHKLGLITTYAVILTAFYFLPFLPSLLAHSL